MKKKLKRRVAPRDREQRTRRKDRRDAKLLLKEIEDLNKQLSFENGPPDKMDSDGPQQTSFAHDWKGISAEPRILIRSLLNFS
jgi:hypothetical protein